MQCQIDLADNKLKFSLEGVEIPFLPDHQIIKKDKPNLLNSSVSSEGSQAEPPQAKKQELIKVLVDMGASEEQAINLLKKSGWNGDIAASMLFELING